MPPTKGRVCRWTKVSNFLWEYKLLMGIAALLYVVCMGLFKGERDFSISLGNKKATTDLDACFDGTKYVESNFLNLNQFDPELVKYVRTRYLIPPYNGEYHFDKPEESKGTDNGIWAMKFYKNKRNGVFIEAGANEGEVHSHTLEMELALGWTGLLIECNPTVTPYLRTKRRKAWVAGVCISTTTHPAILNFSNPTSWTYSGRLGPAWDIGIRTNWTYFDVESIPLYTIIEAAGFKEVDFFSFDVEGVEMDILKHFPFDKIRINLMVIEVQFMSGEKRKELEEFLKVKGMWLVEKQANDHFFVHEDFKL